MFGGGGWGGGGTTGGGGGGGGGDGGAWEEELAALKADLTLVQADLTTLNTTVQNHLSNHPEGDTSVLEADVGALKTWRTTTADPAVNTVMELDTMVREQLPQTYAPIKTVTDLGTLGTAFQQHVLEHPAPDLSALEADIATLQTDTKALQTELTNQWNFVSGFYGSQQPVNTGFHNSIEELKTQMGTLNTWKTNTVTPAVEDVAFVKDWLANTLPMAYAPISVVTTVNQQGVRITGVETSLGTLDTTVQDHVTNHPVPDTTLLQNEVEALKGWRSGRVDPAVDNVIALNAWRQTTVDPTVEDVKDHLANHPSGGDLTGVPTKDDVIRRVWLEIQAYHMGNPLWLPAPNRRCTGLWILSDGSRVNTYNYDGTTPRYGGDLVPLNDLVPDNEVATPVWQWREYFSRQKGSVDATTKTENCILGYTRAQIRLLLPSLHVPRGIRIERDLERGPAGKLRLTRKMGTTFTMLTTVSFNTVDARPDSIWPLRFGIGHIWWNYQPDGIMRLELWPDGGNGQETRVAITGLSDPTIDWNDPTNIRVFGFSVDTAQNKLAVLLSPRVYEWVPPPTSIAAVHDYSRGPEWEKPAHSNQITFTPHTVPDNQVPQRVHWQEWIQGTYVPNPGWEVATPGPDPTNWDPNGIKDVKMGWGALETWENTFIADMNVYEVRTYDEYLPKESLVREAYHIYDTTLRRTNPPTVT